MIRSRSNIQGALYAGLTLRHYAPGLPLWDTMPRKLFHRMGLRLSVALTH